MIIEHLGKSPTIDPSAYIAPNAVISGDVTIGKDCCVKYGAVITAEDGPIAIEESCIVFECAVLRSTPKYSLTIGKNCLIGPHSHLVGCQVKENVFVATGACIFYGAELGARSEIRVNGVVHVHTKILEDQVVPIGWIGVGNPAEILPPNEHGQIWSQQEPLNFPKAAYDVNREGEGESIMPSITKNLGKTYLKHKKDNVIALFENRK